MDLEPSPEALKAIFSELAHLLILPGRIVVEPGQLGVGGYGSVYLATLDKSSESPRKVAVKQLRIVHASVGPQRIAFRLARELKVWAKVKHPNILELIGYYISENYVDAQFVSAYMVNGNVKQYIGRNHPSAAIRLKFVRDIATGLKYLHDFPICHGDLKPANVLVSDSLDAVLCDFGVSSFVNESGESSGLTTSKSTKGAFRYMSPELILDDEPKHTLQSDIWAWGCTAFEVITERIPYSTKPNSTNIVVEMLRGLAPGSIEALNIVILGTDVDPACHPGVSSLRSIIPRCWNFDPTQRPPASNILQCITIPSKAEGSLGPLENQEGEMLTLDIGDDGERGGASQQATDVAPSLAHALLMNRQQYPEVGGQDFCLKACLNKGSSRLSTGSENNALSQRLAVSNFSNLSSLITATRDTPHSMRAGSNPSAGELNGLFKEREPILQENGTIRQDQEKKPQAGAETTKFSNEAAGAPGKNADKDAAASPRTSSNSALGGRLQDTSQGNHSGLNQVGPSRKNPRQNEDSGARGGPFNSLAQETSEDPQPFIYQYLASTFKKILCIRRVSKGSSKAPFPSLPSTQHRRSSVFETTEDDGPTEPKPPTNAASPETNISTAKSDDSIRMVFAGPDMSVFGSDVQVSLPTGPDARLFESSGQAIGWAETMPIRPPPAWRPKSHRHRKTRPPTMLGGFKPPETPGQAPFPPAPSAEHRRRSISAVSDEALESKRHSWAKQSAPGGSLPVSTDPDIKFPHPSDDSTLQIRPRLEIDELWDDLSSPTRESLKRLDVLDRSGQLTERTETKFTGGFSDVSQAKLGGRVVAVKALRVKNIGGAESQRWERRLARELYVWATLDHPNVLELLGFAFEDGGPCLISPWCDNGTLQEYLQKFPEANRRRLVGEIAEGLRYLHLQTPPIVHGDLKTANVFVTSYDVAKISGLGTSRRVEEPRALSNTDDDLSLATIRYTAPEILRDGQDFTLLSDVFSFACVVLETMTDKFPFWKIANDVQVLTEVVFKKQTPSLEDHPGMEEAIWELLRRCWNYEPSDRPTMIEVCRALAEAGYGSSVGFYPPPRAGPSNTFYPPTRGSTI